MIRYYWIDYSTGKAGMLRFYNSRANQRIRTPRKRAQKRYGRFGGIPFIPFRIEHYSTPTFYYANTMRHRRKQDLDCGICKVKYGLHRALWARESKQ